MRIDAYDENLSTGRLKLVMRDTTVEAVMGVWFDKHNAPIIDRKNH